MNSKFFKAIALIVVAYAFTVALYAEEPTTTTTTVTSSATTTTTTVTGTPTFIGSAKCKICHKGEKNGGIFEVWEGSAHAKSMAVLVEKGEDKNPACLGCHTTGNGTGGYGAEGMAEVDLASVGCEACHGAGSEYKTKKVMEDVEAAKAAGLIIPTEETCKTCHNEKSPTFKGFNYAEYWAKIAHKVPEAAAETPAKP